MVLALLLQLAAVAVKDQLRRRTVALFVQDALLEVEARLLLMLEYLGLEHLYSLISLIDLRGHGEHVPPRFLLVTLQLGHALLQLSYLALFRL